MTDKEITAELECCITTQCKSCRYRCEHVNQCTLSLKTDALDLINRQKAEIEILNEKERILIFQLYEEREKAIKEFAERLKVETISFVEYDEGGWGERVTAVKTSSIDNLVEEMTERGR